MFVLGLILAVSLLVLTLPVFPGSGVFAAPGTTGSDRDLYQNVGYLGPDNAAQLTQDFVVLVPSDVPAPFGGEPAVSAGPGFYSLYWMNEGGAPTFLQVTGAVGGTLPAGSKNDLNNELSINATVRGNEAIQDLTVNYDAVYWIADGVLYTVESQNMPGGSLGLAESLIQYVGPETETPVEELPPDAGGGILETPTIAPDLPDGSTDSGAEGDVTPVATSEVAEEPGDGSGGELVPPVEAAVQPTIPAQPDAEPTDEPEGEPGQPVEAETTEPTPEPGQPEAGTIAEPTTESQEGLTPEATVEPDVVPEGDVSVGSSTSGSNAGSDGTGGPPLPVFGGDGTGGTRDLFVPEREE